MTAFEIIRCRIMSFFFFFFFFLEDEDRKIREKSKRERECRECWRNSFEVYIPRP